MYYGIFTAQQMFVGAAFVMAVFLIVIVVLVIRKNPVDAYERITSILTPPEQHFYRILSPALSGRALVMCKVRIADILRVRRGVSHRDFWKHFSQISQKHIDFVLVDPQTFVTLCLIELDDRSHGRSDRMKRDRFVNHIVSQTGIPLLRFPVRSCYNRSEILSRLRPYI